MTRIKHKMNCIHCGKYDRSMRVSRSALGEDLFYVKCRCGSSTDVYETRAEAWEAWDEDRVLPPIWWN